MLHFDPQVFATMLQAAPETGWTLERTLKVAADAALIIALGFTAFQMMLMRSQLEDTRHSTRMSRTLDFCHRWNELDFAKYRKPVYELFETEPDLSEVLDRINSDAAFKAALRYLLNFYEELGLAYNRSEVDQLVIRDYYIGQIEFLYQHTRPYIEHMRSKDDEDIWAEFTKMQKEIKSLKKS